MTDNEIIKASECCRNNEKEDTCEYCLSCPIAHCDLDEDEELNCLDAVFKRALDLINRQQMEIERLQSMNQAKLDMIHDIRAELETAKSEAIKEFAEKLKERAYLDGAVSITQEMVVDVRDIDDIVEEMCKTSLKKLEKMCGKDEEK